MDNIYKTILEDALAGYWDWNIPANEEYLSPSYKAMFGYEDHELENTPATWQNLIFEDDLDIVLNNFNEHVKSLGTIPYYNEVRFKHKNGSTVWVICTGRIIEWTAYNEPLRMVGCHIDITKQKTENEQLKKTKSLLNEIGKISRIGGWEINLLTKKITWTKVTRQIHEVLDDYVPFLDAATGTGFKFIQAGECRKKASEAFKELIKTGKPFDLELEIITQTGKHIWVRKIGNAEFKNGICERIYGTIQDIDAKKRMQQDLEISEKQFRGIFEYSAIGMALVSTEGKLFKVNNAFCDILGYSNEELIEKTFQEITHPDDLDGDLELLRLALKSEIENYNLEKRYYHKNGKIIWVWLTVSLIKDSQGAPLHFVSQVIDITDRKEADIQLKKVNQELSSLFNATTHVSIISCDTNGIIKNFNRGAEILLGYKAEEVIGMFAPDLIHLPSEIKKRSEELSALYQREIKGFAVFIEGAKQNSVEAREWTNVRKDGTTFPVQVVITPINNEHDEIVGYLGIATDISEFKRVEKALRDSEQRWQFAIEGTGDGLWDMNLVTNEVFHSEQCNAMIGFTTEEFGNQLGTWEIRIHPEDREEHDKELGLFLQGKKQGVYFNQHRVLCKDGNYKWILDRGKIIEWDKDNKPLRMIGTHADITEQKEKERQLRNTFDIISEQNNRLLNFAHIVSHNLRSHSGNFQMLMEMVFDDQTTVNERNELLNHLKNVSEKLNETISNLNNVVTIQTNINLQKTKLNLQWYIKKTLEVIAGDISRHKVIVRNRVSPEYEIVYNPAYLESILLNFFTNGIKYRSPARQPEITIECYLENGHDVLIFEDNGVGIDLDMHGDSLFGMYKTFHGNKDAKGIGLFITKNQIEALGGRIEVESQVGEWTRFKVYLS